MVKVKLRNSGIMLEKVVCRVEYQGYTSTKRKQKHRRMSKGQHNRPFSLHFPPAHTSESVQPRSFSQWHQSGSPYPLAVLNRIMRQKGFGLLARAQELKRRLDDAVEKEGEVDEQGKAEDLQPLERLPAKAKRHNPDKECAASIDCRTGCGADTARDGEAKEVETTRSTVKLADMHLSIIAECVQLTRC